MKRLFTGGPIYTMNAPGEIVEAVVVSGDRILATGPFASLKATYAVKNDEMIDLEGHTMYPGFVDSHLHMIGYGESLLRLDLSAETSSRDVIQVLIREMEGLQSEWLIADGLNENNWKDRQMMSIETLDAISPYHPIVLHRICKHAMLVNAETLRRAGIDAETPDPPGGVIGRFGDGRLNGWLYDGAQEVVKQLMPQADQMYLDRALRASVSKLLSFGLTGGHTEDLAYYQGMYPTLSSFKRVIDGERLSFRTQLLINHLCMDERDRFDGFADARELLEWGAIKLFADGSFGGRTAWLSHPYDDDKMTSGVKIHTNDALEQIICRARAIDKTVAIHAIGDAALAIVLDLLEKHPPNVGDQDRIIHASYASKRLIEKMAQLPIALDIQPQFVVSDFPWILDRLGERANLLYPWKTYEKHGLRLAGGSDAPIETPDPRLGIYAAIARKKRSAVHNGYFPAEKLSMFEAISLYTTGSAWISGHANSRGRIAEGFVADFSIFEQDFFALEETPEAILDNAVSQTIVSGKTQYKQTSPNRN
ncbi:amidohydrolase [Aureibacillus halotolerans]|uniref:Uncharacterized protein n=1 Tax=Aureibacillus halotolerans TaxID=1508390 RepID=A0A4R6U1F2_9BACI|nr:amidohydrolase [Aureibacillus halotolerans]TDQ39102.1 hypothetical protein EV213_10849 [Aureibacillus halotolerans]